MGYNFVCRLAQARPTAMLHSTIIIIKNIKKMKEKKMLKTYSAPVIQVFKLQPVLLASGSAAIPDNGAKTETLYEEDYEW